MGVSFFKLPKYYVFTYKPRYYNPEEEERQERIRQAKIEAGVENDEKIDEKGNYRPNIKGRMRSRFVRNKRKQKSSTIRLILVFLFLSLLAYYLLFY